MSIESLTWKNLPKVANATTTDSNSTLNRKITIKCLLANQTWNIDYTNRYRSNAILDEVMEPVMKKFPCLRKYDSSSAGVTSTTSLASHNRIAIALTAHMMWHGTRDGKNDGGNKYTSYKRALDFKSKTTPVWTVAEMWNKEKVPIGREWSEMK